MARYSFECNTCGRTTQRIVKIDDMNSLQPCHRPDKPGEPSPDPYCGGDMKRVEEVGLTARMSHQWTQR